MDNLYHKVFTYLYNNNVDINTANARSYFKIMNHNDGNGDIIAEWNAEVPKPSQQDLDAITQDTINRTFYIVLRKAQYPSVTDQMDEVMRFMEAITENNPIPASVTDMISKWRQVKTDNPKPE